MKKAIFLLILILLIPIVQTFVIPDIVTARVSSIYYVSPEVSQYKNIVNCSGVVVSENQQDISASGAFSVVEVNVKVGDIIKKDTVLFTTAATDMDIKYDFGAINENDIKKAIINSAVEQFLAEEPQLGMIIPNEYLSGNFIKENYVTVTPVYRAIKSPIDGIITQINVSEGSYVIPGKSLIKIEDIKNYKVVASVSESEIAKIKVGDRAVIRGTAFGDMNYSGKVRSISPTAKKVYSGTNYDTVVEVEIVVENPNNRLKSGFSAKVEISSEDYFDILSIPYETIRQDSSHSEYVYIYDDGKIKKANIIVGRELANVVEILDGIYPDSIVIYNPDDVPGEGAIVNIRGRAEKV